MDITDFPERNVIVAKHQPQYVPMLAHHSVRDGLVICCWRLSWHERVRLLFTGRIWHSILTFNQPLQPQKLELVKPDMPPAAAQSRRIG